MARCRCRVETGGSGRLSGIIKTREDVSETFTTLQKAEKGCVAPPDGKLFIFVARIFNSNSFSIEDSFRREDCREVEYHLGFVTFDVKLLGYVIIYYTYYSP